MESSPEQGNLILYADDFTVGDASLALISRQREPVEPGQEPSAELLVGDVLRRTCRLGGEACAKVCQAPKGYDNESKDCSDKNLSAFIKSAGIDKNRVLMVGVTADNIGFYDSLAEYEDDLSVNSEGIRELPGYNAFFARSSEDVVIGARLADCGFAAIEFDDSNGEEVIGFVHMTRPNLQGESALEFEIEGRAAGSFEYFLHEAMNHYGGDLSTARVRLIAAIKPENYIHNFSDEEKMSELFPGWFEQGLIKNISNPDWKPGEQVTKNDVWKPQYRDMLLWHIMRSGISQEQLSDEGLIDPGDLVLGHASNHASSKGKIAAGRDAYMVMPRNLSRALPVNEFHPSSHEVISNPDSPCPIEILVRQVAINVPYIDFDGNLQKGVIEVDKDVRKDVIDFFAKALELKFPIEKVVPSSHPDYEWDDEKLMANNMSSGFNYRVIAGTDIVSPHGQGRALDINPRLNPYIRYEADEIIVAPKGAIWDISKPGTLFEEHPLVSFMKNRGWEWGGDWTPDYGRTDYHHFQKL